MTQSQTIGPRKWFTTLRARLLIAFVLLALLPAGVISVCSIVVAYNYGIKQTFKQLEAVAALKQAGIRNWIRNLRNDLRGLAEDGVYMTAVPLLTKGPAEAGFQADYENLLDRFHQVIRLTNRFKKLFIMSPKGMVVLSTHPEKTDAFIGMQSYFKEGQLRPGLFVQSNSNPSVSGQMSSVLVVHPVKDRNGKVLGLLCGQANFDAVDAIMAEWTGLGETAETYLVGTNHELMTVSRFSGFTPGISSIYAQEVNKTLQNQADGQGFFLDYRGIPVIGIYHWLPELQAVFVAKQDRREVFQPIYTTLALNASVALIAVLLASVAALKFIRNISSPVASLSAAAARIAEGDLERTAKVDRQDEIGFLAQAFNHMTARLRSRIEALENQRAQTALQESEVRFRTVVDASKDAMIAVDQKGRITLFNPAAEKMFGYPQDSVTCRSLDCLIPEEDRKSHREYVEGFLAENGPESSVAGRTFELQALKMDGTIFPIELSLSAGQFDDNRFVLAVIRDVTQRKTAEEDLRRLRNLLKNIVDSMPSVLVGVDAEGRVTQWNLEAEKATGIVADAAQGRMLIDVFPLLAGEMENVRKAIRRNEPQKKEKIATRVQGETQYTEVTVYPLISRGIEGAVIRMDDVTERVRIEEMMIQSEKMISLGGLAAGMAHEISNPLSIILQGTQNILLRLSHDHPKNIQAADQFGIDLKTLQAYFEDRGISRFMESIRESGARAANIVYNMMNFSHKKKKFMATIPLEDLLDKAIELAAHDYELNKAHDFRRIKILKDVDPDVARVCCMVTEIEQVVLNLLRNAAQAAKDDDLSPKILIITLRVRNDNKWVRLEVEDNGTGMDKATSKRIFEPFFTTKPLGIGTGLGLSVSYFIITRNHGGTIEVDSESGRGTRFIIRLPGEQYKAYCQ